MLICAECGQQIPLGTAEVMPGCVSPLCRRCSEPGCPQPPVKGQLPPRPYKPLPAFPRGGKDTQFFVQ